MLITKTALMAVLVVANMATADAELRATRNIVDPTKELHIMMKKTRILKGDDGDRKNTKVNKSNPVPPSANPTALETSAPTALPTGPPTASPTRFSPMTGQPTPSPVSPPAANPASFDATIEVVCQPDGTTTLTLDEARVKTIICNADKPSCREAVTAVQESEQLQNFFGCAGDLGEAAARKLFHMYASDDRLAAQLTLVADVGVALVTERPDAMQEACMAMAMAQSPPVANPCCQGSSGCTAVTASASAPPPFMTVAITACTGDSACKDMGPNPLILDSSCTGESACELVNENEINPFITGVTFVGEMACTTARSCEGVGRRSHGDVTIQTGACIGPDACNAAGRRVKQSGSSFRFRSHIDIGLNACVGSNACKDAHSTVNHGAGGKVAGSLTIGDGGCVADRSCEKMGFNDRMRTDIVVRPDGCGSVDSCRGCMTKTECGPDEAYLISNTAGACPVGGSDSNNNPTGDTVEEFCVGKGTLPTECPTFFPTPFPTPLTSRPTNSPTNLISALPTALPSDRPSQTPSQAPSSLPSGLPSQMPSDIPSSSPSDNPSLPPSGMPSDFPSGLPSEIPSDIPSSSPSDSPSQTPSDQPSDIPSTLPSEMPSRIPSSSPSDLPSEMPSRLPSDLPSEMPSSLPSDMPSESPSRAPSDAPSEMPSDLPSTPPSEMPSDIPSSSPSDLPSNLPSEMPSDIPSASPSVSQAPSNLPSSGPSQEPTRTSSPTLPPAFFTVGCLEGPGNTGSAFNLITAGAVFCDSGTDTCADFVAAVDALGDKGKMIKSIFGCDDDATTPQAVELAVAQKRFNEVKNEASVTTALLTAVEGTKKLYSGSGAAVTAACGSNCCTGTIGCTTSPSAGVLTVSDASCDGDRACFDLFPGTIILESCDTNDACNLLGAVTGTLPSPTTEVGFRVVGPGACLGRLSCQNVGRNMLGNVRVETGACDGQLSCVSMGGRSFSIPQPPRVTNIFVGENACKGQSSCSEIHSAIRGETGKPSASVRIEKDACDGDNVCKSVAANQNAINDLVIEEGACVASKPESCNACVREVMCGGNAALTYVISEAAADCPGPNADACKNL